MGSLIYLNLKDNLIYDLCQGLFSNLGKLEILILSENKFESIKKYFFQGLESLKKLDLSDNQIGFLNKDSFHFTLKLENLCLKSNLISNLNSSLLVLENLSTLDLSSNNIESFGTNDISSKVISLDLSFNPLKQFEYNQSNLFNLKSLKLSSTNSSLISNINFERFIELEELDLSNNLNINKKQIKN